MSGRDISDQSAKRHEREVNTNNTADTSDNSADNPRLVSRTASLDAEDRGRSWIHQVPTAMGDDGLVTFPQSDEPLMPEFEDAVNNLSASLARRKSTGSRFFGSTGVLGGVQGASSVGHTASEKTQNASHYIHAQAAEHEPANPAAASSKFRLPSDHRQHQATPAALEPSTSQLFGYRSPIAAHEGATSAAVRNNAAGHRALAAANESTTPVTVRDGAAILPFSPSRIAQVTSGQIPDAPRAPIQNLQALGVSANYRGDISVPENLSANIPDEQNCSFWIRRLPATTTVNTLLAAVRAIGRVYCTVITPPNHSEGWHTSAAKLVFFEETAAKTFWNRYGKDGEQQLPFVVGGMRAIVERNRTKVTESDQPRDRTRVLCVSGPEALVNVNALMAEFAANFVFQMDEVVATTQFQGTDNGFERIRTVEFRFGSFRCQSQNAHRLLYGRAGLAIWYGRDPCDV